MFPLRVSPRDMQHFGNGSHLLSPVAHTLWSVVNNFIVYFHPNCDLAFRLAQDLIHKCKLQLQLAKYWFFFHATWKTTNRHNKNKIIKNLSTILPYRSDVSLATVSIMRRLSNVDLVYCSSFAGERFTPATLARTSTNLTLDLPLTCLPSVFPIRRTFCSSSSFITFSKESQLSLS